MIVERKSSLLRRKILAHGFLLIFLALIMFPFLMVLSISFREGNFSTGSLFPERPTLEHWALALGFDYTRADGTVITPPYPVLLWLGNSIKVGLIASAGVLVLSTTSAYAFARMPFKGRQGVLDTLLIVQMFPAALAVVAIYAIFDTLGRVVPWLGVDSHPALILSYLSAITLHIWTIKGYFDSVDPALDKAAQIDGATPWQAFRYIFLPLSVPILAVVFVLAFIFFINEYPVASVLLRETDKMTLAVGARQYLYEQKYLWGDFAAAAILSGLPITVLFLIAQRFLVSGLSDGAVKG
ncbi:Maltose transport system permease protein MalG [Pseudoruegeria aquimaris]|uniref:Maltose/maltodextrin transport system permease protein MalG n=1 Tax=Pseudoruegeria aquimaris TaxID=393663 RepID=A0A1Y5S336_9RHOB|nr:maltose ABC transporter permease MalG [Pseudoruegeria aquimaris]SLN31640.1 Maltose transport system permease protein MalG [Pseudoruegeria aquimaris]